jgi:hypothetical protein
MKYQQRNCLQSDMYGVLGQPLYLLIVLIITTAIICLFALSIQRIIIDRETQQVEHEINRIITEATNMFEYADEGTRVTLHVEFPASMRFIVFGALPTENTAEPMDRTLNENTSNNYYFVMNDNTFRSYHSNTRFSNQNFTQMVVLHSGTFSLTLELCSYEGKTYVTLY